MLKYIVAVALMFTVACSGSKDKANEENAASAEGSGETQAHAEIPAETDLDTDIPVPEEFEAEMVADITPENYKAELDELAQEIESE